jgi:hypothetical protein
VELLAGLLLVSVLSSMAYAWTRAVLLSARVQEQATEVQEAAVMAADFVVRELRMAGYSHAGAPLAGVRAAGRDFVSVAADLNGDGDTNDAHERIAYAHNLGRTSLMRATGGGRPQPVVRNVPGGGLSFAFFDDDGRQLGGNGAALDDDDLGRVRRIDVRVLVLRRLPELGGRDVQTEVFGSACLRNR